MRSTDILLLSRTINPLDHLSSDVIVALKRIQQESPRKSVPQKNTSKKNTIQKTTFKKKAESFDDAMRMKIIADLNKLSDKNYDVILKQIQALYSRISDDQKPWALRLIVDNSTKQHIYAGEYMRLFMDITKDTPEDRSLGSSILQESVNQHEEKILTEITNGESYDDFCEANKVKTSRIGLSIVIGEACNLGLIPPNVIGQHAINLLQTMQKIRDKSDTTSKEAIENQTECVLQFFKTIAKTKITRDGFQKCISDFETILEEEKKEKKLNPKARFALMDFVDEMKKNYREAKEEEELKKKNVYVPGSFGAKRTV